MVTELFYYWILSKVLSLLLLIIINNTVVGDKVIRALENSVCQYPKMEGRFAQVAGVTFGFDPTCLPGERVHIESVKVQDEYIELHKVS